MNVNSLELSAWNEIFLGWIILVIGYLFILRILKYRRRVLQQLGADPEDFDSDQILTTSDYLVIRAGLAKQKPVNQIPRITREECLDSVGSNGKVWMYAMDQRQA